MYKDYLPSGELPQNLQIQGWAILPYAPQSYGPAMDATSESLKYDEQAKKSRTSF